MSATTATTATNLTAAFQAEMDKVETRQAERKSPLEHFHEILNRLNPEARKPQPIHVVSKRTLEAIQKQCHPSDSRNPLSHFEHYAGVQIHMMEHQVTDCLIFHSRTLADAYLKGQLTEQEVLALSKPLPTTTP